MSHYSDRNYAIIAARDLVNSGALVLDTETTGLSEAAEVVELAIIDMSGRVLMDTLVRPTLPIPAAATEIHGITQADVANEPTMADLWPILKGHIDSKPITTYNAEFDMRMLRQSVSQAGLGHTLHGSGGQPPTLGTPVTCAMDLYASYWGEWSDHHRSYTWQPLDRACQQQGIKLTPGLKAHRALADAEATRLLLHHIAQQNMDEEPS
jgi:DNA polymerase-3 subunit epsilon